jgi:predicted nucleic acid-binding protein
MRIYFDSSAFAKRFIEEPGSQRIDDICQEASEVGLSIICFPEILSALNRKVREKSISNRNYTITKNRLSEELSDIEIINITPKVVAKAALLLETNPLRAMDAMHVACAIEWDADLFVTSDRRQADAAKNAKLRIESVNS